MKSHVSSPGGGDKLLLGHTRGSPVLLPRLSSSLARFVTGVGPFEGFRLFEEFEVDLSPLLLELSLQPALDGLPER